jgi:hypothetical protein
MSIWRSRGFVLRRVAGYGLPGALRMTIGSEEANLGVIDALTTFMAIAMTKPMFDTIALIGIGLIGSSLARVIAAKGPGRSCRHRHAERRDA